MAPVQRVLAVIVGAVGVAGVVTAASGVGSARNRPAPPIPAIARAAPPMPAAPSSPSTTSAPGTAATTAPPLSVAPTTAPAPATGPVTLLGCPVPPHPPLPPAPPPWHPSVLVPDADLPAIAAPRPWRSQLSPLTGTGMWIWEWSQTAGGNASAIVKQAVAAHLHQLWVRVGDSKNGFYGAGELKALVPAAHAAGLSVIAWGFPYLYDPARDVAWTAQVLAWRGPRGQRVDGYSADIERPSEGVDLSARRAAVYLEGVRRAAGDRLVVATVYPPIDAYWSGGEYPYAAMAPYVDAFAPMIYWECADPGADVAFDVARLSTLRPVHVIGQAFDMADTGGRAVAPSGAEIKEFLAAGRRSGALGASFWVWQHATAQEWAAIAAYRW